ncbi:SAM-dependent methyltransferase [Crossiella equi]|uniref:SAM-dependent methyltransferase n=1 Tax=Crossiella equi TaxID=130796 RepID=A0ABS5AI21_9PSEU|nr:class I SAM-dependent methyltransferase [Crossiella equi]MBP2475884.1 SAM-dependent methyltransferase [Crossiella equi]
MLTVNYDRFSVQAGDRVLDFGCGGGRHTYEAYRRGGQVVALDLDATELKHVRDWCDAMAAEHQVPPGARAWQVRGDGNRLPFPDHSFTKVIAAEVLEHVPDDHAVLAELVRVLAPGGLLAVTVPRWLPERVCWALSREYHEVEGGHVRIYRRGGLLRMLRRHGLRPVGGHHAHALHVPYWWLLCAVGERPFVRRYHRFLEWDIMHGNRLTRAADRLLNPLVGKSLVVYAVKPA